MSSSLRRMPWPWLALCAAVACMAIGWKIGREPLLTQLAEQDAQHTRDQLKAFERNQAVLLQAQDRGDELTTKLADSTDRIDQLTKEKRDAVSQVTTGRTCFGGPALRLLNHGAPGLVAPNLPPTTGSADAEAEAFATDTDVAIWITDAQGAYETCRARLDNLINFHAPYAPTN